MFVVAFAVLAQSFTTYPGFIPPGATVETLIDKQITVEMIVKCPDVAGIMTYSKAEQLFCTPDYTCHSSQAAAIRHMCK
jgi:hypothetical protein